jgi:hypothetical protein
VREDDEVDRVEVQDDGDVGGARQRGGDVHRGDLGGEHHPEDAQRPPLLARDPQAGQAAGDPRPSEDDDAPDEEAYRGQAERRGVLEPDLDRDGVDAPEQGSQQRQRGAAEVYRDVAHRVR